MQVSNSELPGLIKTVAIYFSGDGFQSSPSKFIFVYSREGCIQAAIWFSPTKLKIIIMETVNYRNRRDLRRRQKKALLATPWSLLIAPLVTPSAVGGDEALLNAVAETHCLVNVTLISNKMS